MDLTLNAETRWRCSTEPCIPSANASALEKQIPIGPCQVLTDPAQWDQTQPDPYSKPASCLVPSPGQQLLPPAKAAFYPFAHQTHSHPSLSATTAGEEVGSAPQAAVTPWRASYWPNPAFLFLPKHTHWLAQHLPLCWLFPSCWAQAGGASPVVEPTVNKNHCAVLSWSPAAGETSWEHPCITSPGHPWCQHGLSLQT